MYRNTSIFAGMQGTAVDDQRVIRILKALSDANRFRMVREIAAAGELSC
jgi:hypothetical protein